MANQITLLGTPRVENVETRDEDSIIECDPSTLLITVNEILGAINQNYANIDNLAIEYNSYDKIKTRRDGNILYMTDNGTTP